MNTQPNSRISSESSSCTERRTESRHEVDLLVNRFLDGYPYLCRVTDISRTGMRVIPLHEPATASRFMGLQFQLPGSDEIMTASGEAVSTAGESGALGIRFTRMPQSSADQLGRFLASAIS